MSDLTTLLSSGLKEIKDLKSNTALPNSLNEGSSNEMNENKIDLIGFEKKLKEMLSVNEMQVRSTAEKLKKENEELKSSLMKSMKQSQEESFKMIQALIGKNANLQQKIENSQVPKPGPRPGNYASAAGVQAPPAKNKPSSGPPPPKPISAPAPEKVTVKEIKDSEIRDNDLYYQVLTDKNITDWFLHSDISGAQPEKETFHNSNPGAPSLQDLKVGQWQTVVRKKKRISQKLNKKKTITQQDLIFLKLDKGDTERKPTSFIRLAFKPTNLRRYRQNTYRERNVLLNLYLKSNGLLGYVYRSSWVGASVIEFYIPKEYEERFKLGMDRIAWEMLENYQPETLPSFEGEEPLSDIQKEIRKEKLVHRLGFLYANARLIKLKECILEDLSIDVVERILEHSEKIFRIRNGELSAERSQNYS